MPFHLYNIDWGERAHLETLRDVLYGLILAFPLIFTLGLLPQINTAAMFIMEQLDIQVNTGVLLVTETGSGDTQLLDLDSSRKPDIQPDIRFMKKSDNLVLS